MNTLLEAAFGFPNFRAICGLRVLGVLFFFLWPFAAQSEINLDQVLATLETNASSLGELSILAEEQKTTYSQFDPINRLLREHPEMTAGRSSTTLIMSDVVTSTLIRSYEFGGEMVQISTWMKDPLINEVNERYLITDELVLHFQVFHLPDGATNASVLGEIEPRDGRRIVGWPFFLTKPFLASWIGDAKLISMRAGESSTGEACHRIELILKEGIPIRHYCALLSRTNLKPVEVSSFQEDGTPYSTSELEFTDPAHPSVCTRSFTRYFDGTNVFQEVLWAVTDIQVGDVTIDTQLDSFFPEGARVTDRRLEKPLIYSVGSRIPTDNEMRAMLQSPKAVVDYELTSRSKEESTKLQTIAEQQELRKDARVVRRVIFAVLLTLSSAFLGFMIWRTKGESGDPRGMSRR